MRGKPLIYSYPALRNGWARRTTESHSDNAKLKASRFLQNSTKLHIFAQFRDSLGDYLMPKERLWPSSARGSQLVSKPMICSQKLYTACLTTNRKERRAKTFVQLFDEPSPVRPKLTKLQKELCWIKNCTKKSKSRYFFEDSLPFLSN